MSESKERDDLMLALLEESRSDMKEVKQTVNDLKLDLGKTKVKVTLLASVSLIVFSTVMATDKSTKKELLKEGHKIIKELTP